MKLSNGSEVVARRYQALIKPEAGWNTVLHKECQINGDKNYRFNICKSFNSFPTIGRLSFHNNWYSDFHTKNIYRLIP